jgi:hypothetical protein
MTRKSKCRGLFFSALILVAVSYGFSAVPVMAQSTQPSSYIVEWVYKVKLGHEDEFWQIFKKYQIATLNKEKEQGSVLKYEVFRPGLHTSGDHRWSYRIVIYYKDSTSPARASAIEKVLFPNQAAMKQEEGRRWDLTEDHWDLPIRQTDPNAP